MSKIHILKFGGTSLQNAQLVKQAVSLVQNKANEARPVVVVSAIGGITDRLLSLTEISTAESGKAQELITELRERHLDLLHRVADNPTRAVEKINGIFDELSKVYFDDQHRSQNPEEWRDYILSAGERASAHLFAAALKCAGQKAVQVDARQLIKTDAAFGKANILYDISSELISNTFESIPNSEVAVINGFIGSTLREQTTTLGRSGSDYTASIIADALKAEQLEIWTDVNGVLTADPKIVPGAQNIKYLSFEEISQLSAHGAKVIHPKTINPIKESDIAVHVRNSLKPADQGTLIRKTHSTNGEFRSITVNGPFVYFEIPDGHAFNLIRLLEEKFSEITDSEGFSYSRSSRFEPAEFVIRESLYETIETELNNWKGESPVSPVPLKNLYRVNVFTNKLFQNDSEPGNILQLLDRVDLHPLRIRKEHNRRYLSLLFPREEAHEAARYINDYLLEKPLKVNVFLAGIGTVGGSLLEQIDNHTSDNINLAVTGLCNSSNTVWDDAGLHPGDADQKLSSSEPTDWSSIIKTLTGKNFRPTIFVDATGSEEVARYYPDILEAGIHIATPSKLANTFDQAYYDLLRKKAAKNNASFRYETTVGAALPIISTLNDLLQSEDTITEISGVISGTMTFLFNELENGTSFSKAVIKARELGYAEPDPRADLSGEDVARKFLTMAREIGIRLEWKDLEIESLIPASLANVNREMFLEELHTADTYWEEKIREAKSQGKTLRYTGKLKDGKIKIGIEQLSKNSSLGQLRGTDNLLQIHSLRYNQTPIKIQGPGAGREVTAAGVLIDILKIAKGLS